MFVKNRMLSAHMNMIGRISITKIRPMMKLCPGIDPLQNGQLHSVLEFEFIFELVLALAINYPIVFCYSIYWMARFKMTPFGLAACHEHF